MAYTANLIPTMTSNTAPEGVASAANTYGGYAAWKAMDKTYTINDCWAGSIGATTGYLRYQFATTQVITKYDLHCDNDPDSGAGRMVHDWTFQGSDNGVDWTTLDTQTGITWTYNETKEYPISNTTSYTYYQVNFTEINGGALPAIGEIYMYGTEGGGADVNATVTDTSTLTEDKIVSISPLDMKINLQKHTGVRIV